MPRQPKYAEGPIAAADKVGSLTGDMHPECMSPVDELFAWKALAAEGRSLEDIAADFGVTPLVVKRRLKLANVSPRLLADYQQGTVSLEQLMALAITDDHAAQETALCRYRDNAAYVEQKIMPSTASKTLIRLRKFGTCSA